jgi:hypothetical protein
MTYPRNFSFIFNFLLFPLPHRLISAWTPSRFTLYLSHPATLKDTKNLRDIQIFLAKVINSSIVNNFFMAHFRSFGLLITFMLITLFGYMEFISYLCDYKLIFSYSQALSISACNNSMGGLEGWLEIVSKLYSGKSGLSDTHTQALKPW